MHHRLGSRRQAHPCTAEERRYSTCWVDAQLLGCRQGLATCLHAHPPADSRHHTETEYHLRVAGTSSCLLLFSIPGDQGRRRRPPPDNQTLLLPHFVPPASTWPPTPSLFWTDFQSLRKWPANDRATDIWRVRDRDLWQQEPLGHDEEASIDKLLCY